MVNIKKAFVDLAHWQVRCVPVTRTLLGLMSDRFFPEPRHPQTVFACNELATQTAVCTFFFIRSKELSFCEKKSSMN